MEADLIQEFIVHEKYAVSMLLESLENRDKKAKIELTFNLFDFEVDFMEGSVLVVDVCGLFCGKGEPREQILPIKSVRETLSNVAQKT